MSQPQFTPPPDAQPASKKKGSGGPLVMTVAFVLWLMCALGITLAYFFYEPPAEPEPIPDAGMPDAGYDAGFDAGYDAGYDAGHDAGHDAGAPPEPSRPRPRWWGSRRR